MHNWLQNMIGQKKAEPQGPVEPAWERLWISPEWAIRARREFPWRNKQDMLSDLREWLGPHWGCVDIAEDRTPGASTGEYSYLTKVISLDGSAWARLEKGFQRQLNAAEGWQLFHFIVHEALHGYSPVSREFKRKGRGLSDDEYVTLQIFEEGFTECLAKGLLNQWSDVVEVEDKVVRLDLPFVIYPVEVGMIEDLVGLAQLDNEKLKKWWSLSSSQKRSRMGDELAVIRIREILVYAGITEKEAQKLISPRDLSWRFFYPAQRGGRGDPPARFRGSGRVLPVLLRRAEALQSRPKEDIFEWAYRGLWQEEAPLPDFHREEEISPKSGSTRVL